MSRSTLEWYELLARSLVWAAGIVLLLALVGAIVVAGSENAVGIAPEAEQQGRGFIALASLGGGIAAAGVLGGLGALLRVLVTDRLEKLGPAAAEGEKNERSAARREPFDAGDDGTEEDDDLRDVGDSSEPATARAQSGPRSRKRERK